MSKLTVEPTKPQYKFFDWVVSWPVIRLLKPIYEWKRSFWIYCVLGFISTILGTGLKLLFVLVFGLLASVASVVSWIITTLVAFTMFRYMYFDRTNNTFINELIKFTGGRFFTLGLDVVVNLITVDILKWNVTLVTILMIPVTAIVNYFISKIFVFKDKKTA